MHKYLLFSSLFLRAEVFLATGQTSSQGRVYPSPFPEEQETGRHPHGHLPYIPPHVFSIHHLPRAGGMRGSQAVFRTPQPR